MEGPFAYLVNFQPKNVRIAHQLGKIKTILTICIRSH